MPTISSTCRNCGGSLKSSARRCPLCEAPNRPASATNIGWIAILLGVGSSLHCLVDLCNRFRFTPIHQATSGRDDDYSNFLTAVIELKAPSYLITLISLALAIAMVAAGKAVLQLRSWGRYYLLVNAWLGLFATPVAALLFGWMILSIVPTANSFSYFLFAMLGLMTILQLALIGWALRHLHGAELKDAIERANLSN